MCLNVNRLVVVLFSAVIFSACTSIKVQPVGASENIKEICIQKNPNVQDRDFLNVLQNRLAYHHIQSQILENRELQSCVYSMTYTALRTWDITTYLSHAELYLYKNGRQIAQAEYHLLGGGGLTFSKFDSTQTKMEPVIDQLLGRSGRVRQDAPASVIQPRTSPVPVQQKTQQIEQEQPLMPIN
ncbi:Sbal_3080 family lipoprotein [Eikenella corrodens]|uniref:Sbal_3080 family lipoprotein n=1 Tax=Eikenella corrodens TaxID=539 RepID=UPI000A5127DD|nr:Sbal_3080 family lipoprotein [Eikenella corrodens]